MVSTASPLFVFRALAGWWRRGFRFGCWPLVGLLLTGCAGRVSQFASTATYISPAHRVSGYVLDAVSKQPLAGIPVAKYGTRTTSAKDGFFRLDIPASVKSAYNPNAVEELAVELSDYAGRAYIPTDTTQRITLPLLRNTYRFPPDGRLQPADSVHALPCAKPWRALPGMYQAFLIQDNSIHQPRKLRAITFRFGERGFAREPFRIRLYRYNGPDQPPGEDLLTEFYLVSAPKQETYTYDLSDYNVILPASGFFLGLEYVFSMDKFYTSEHMVGYVPVGPLLRPPYAFADTRTWDYTTGKGWQRVPAAQTCWPRYESSVSVEVEPAR